MVDIALNTSDWDIEFDGVNISTVDKHEEIKQSLIIVLRMGLGEWMFDIQAGTGYLGFILIKNPYLPAVEAELRRAASTVEGVKEIKNVTLDWDKPARHLTAGITAISIYNRELQVVV